MRSSCDSILCVCCCVFTNNHTHMHISEHHDTMAVSALLWGEPTKHEHGHESHSIQAGKKRRAPKINITISSSTGSSPTSSSLKSSRHPPHHDRPHTLQTAPRSARPRWTDQRCQQHVGSARPTGGSPAGPSSPCPQTHPGQQQHECQEAVSQRMHGKWPPRACAVRYCANSAHITDLIVALCVPVGCHVSTFSPPT